MTDIANHPGIKALPNIGLVRLAGRKDKNPLTGTHTRARAKYGIPSFYLFSLFKKEKRIKRSSYMQDAFRILAGCFCLWGVLS